MKKIVLLSILFLFVAGQSMAQRLITGEIKDSEDDPLGYADIVVKGTDTGCTADFEGYFEMMVPEEPITLVVSFLGYESKEIDVKANQSFVSIQLKVNETTLAEVAVVSGARLESEKEMSDSYSYMSASSAPAATADKKRKKKKDKVADMPKLLEGKLGGMETTIPTTPSEPLPPPPPPVIEEVPAEATFDAYDDVMMEMDEAEIIDVIESGSVSMEVDNLPSAGQLTAGILNDFGKWNLWQDIQENELRDWQQSWGIRPWDRYPIQLTTQNGYPIINATVSLMDKDVVIWTSRTDNTGKAELWANLYQDEEPGSYSMNITYQGEVYQLDEAKSFHEGGNAKTIPVQCNINHMVDIAIVVDATGSMSDEISYLKSELRDVIERSKETLENSDLRLGSVFYRDLGDAYVTRKSHFSDDISKTVRFIEGQSAAGGGDGPEAIEEAFDETLDGLVWRDDASAKLMFLVLDAPPHQTEEIMVRLKKQIERAAAKGIRVIPVACSGTDRSTEYLMRSIALATNGSYIYLTDDSGIGGSHQKPITDEHKVDLLNDLLVKTITDFSSTASCDEQLDFAKENVQDTMTVELVAETNDSTQQKVDIIKDTEFSWKYYPNPCGGTLWVEIEGELDYLYLFDNSGKLLRRISINGDKLELDLSVFPSGIYYLRGIGKDGREVSGKVILTRTY